MDKVPMTVAAARGRSTLSYANQEHTMHRLKLPSAAAICVIAAVVPPLAHSQSAERENVALPTPNSNVFPYPSPARLRCITGRLLASYRVLPNGTFADAQVVAAYPKGVFERDFLYALHHSRANVPAGWTEAAARRVLYTSVAYELYPCTGDSHHYTAADVTLQVCAAPIPGACPQ